MSMWVGFILVLGSAVLLKSILEFTNFLEPPTISIQNYWGPSKSKSYKEVTTITPFNISTSSELIDDLKEQLSRPLNLQPPLENVAFEYGFNSKELLNIVKYWRDNYLERWPQRENYLNKFPHFMTEIQGLQIHYIHVKPIQTKDGLNNVNVMPLLLLHGWPGSIREFYDFIPLLTTVNKKNNFVFEVIAPSLPGYGFSQASSKPGLGPIEIGVVMRNLMLRLGHTKFLLQGGDWGSIVASHIAALYPENVIALHSNMCTAFNKFTMLKEWIKDSITGLFFNKEHHEFFKSPSELFTHIMQESGYMHLQASKPDTIGIALSNNPVGLAAYILEKFSTWTNIEYQHLPDGGLTKRFSLDALLDNIMIYYITNTITTSQRLYAEHFSKKQQSIQLENVFIHTPTGCARFLHDIMHHTDSHLKTRYRNLIHSSYYKVGGHFAAMELPEVLYVDFIEFLEKLKPDNNSI